MSSRAHRWAGSAAIPTCKAPRFIWLRMPRVTSRGSTSPWMAALRAHDDEHPRDGTAADPGAAQLRYAAPHCVDADPYRGILGPDRRSAIRRRPVQSHFLGAIARAPLRAETQA